MITGLTYIEKFITEDEQKSLIEQIDRSAWDLSLKRRTQHYGFKYDYTKKRIDSSLFVGEIPEYLKVYCDRLTEWFDESPDQIIINEYFPGQGISRHVDCVPCFDKTIASLSLNSSYVMDFEELGTYNRVPLLLEPQSLLVLTGDARYKWLHSIAPRVEDIWDEKVLTRDRRLSLTFRKVILS